MPEYWVADRYSSVIPIGNMYICFRDAALCTQALVYLDNTIQGKPLPHLNPYVNHFLSSILFHTFDNMTNYG